MQLRDAVSPVPDQSFARKVAIATCLTTVIAVGGAIGVALSSRPAARMQAVPVVHYEIKLAQWELNTYVTEAFPQWAAANHETACPRDLLELNRHRVFLHAVDPWGSPYQFFCTNGVLSTRAAGPDGRYDTTDDLASAVP